MNLLLIATLFRRRRRLGCGRGLTRGLGFGLGDVDLDRLLGCGNFHARSIDVGNIDILWLAPAQSVPGETGDHDDEEENPEPRAHRPIPTWLRSGCGRPRLDGLLALEGLSPLNRLFGQFVHRSLQVGLVIRNCASQLRTLCQMCSY